MCPKVCIFLGKNAYSNLRTLGFSRLWMTVSLATTEVCVFRALASVGALFNFTYKKERGKSTQEEKRMLCENRLCIYWNDRRCRLKTISVDKVSRCECYTPIELGNEELRRLRREALKKYKPQEAKEN